MAENQGHGSSFKLSGQGGSIVIWKRWGRFQEEATVSTGTESERPVPHTGKDSSAVKHAEPYE